MRYLVPGLAGNTDLPDLFALIQPGMDLCHGLDFEHHVGQDTVCRFIGGMRIRVISSSPDISWRLFLTRWWISRSSTSFSCKDANKFFLGTLAIGNIPVTPDPADYAIPDFLGF
jgi:hypothetical protein